MQPHTAHLSDAVRELRAGRVSPSSYVEACRDRVDDVEPEVRALVEEDDRWDRIAERVDELESAVSRPGERPALYGVPVGVKDIFHVDGMETRAGTSIPPSALAGPEATAWERLDDAGAVPLGKTVTTEFAYFAPGPTRNPHDTSRTPGGSSSGSAAAVAAGLCPLAVGSQTIGSVVRPAAFCGVVGFKPSYGRVPVEGVIPVSPSLDHVGVFTQDVAGARVASAVVCDGWRTVPEPDGRPVLGVPSDAYLEQAEDVGLRRFERQLDTLAAAGYEIHRTDALSDVASINEGHDRLMAAEMAMAHRENGWYPAYEDEYADATLELLGSGEEVSAAEVGAERARRLDRRDDLTAGMDDRGIDVWVSPAAPGPAPEGIDDTGDPSMNRPWTNAGLPTLTLPVDETDEGLPLGLQCSARFGADEELLGWAERLADDLGLLTGE